MYLKLFPECPCWKGELCEKRGCPPAVEDGTIIFFSPAYVEKTGNNYALTTHLSDRVCESERVLQPEMLLYISVKRWSLSWENRASVLSMVLPPSWTPVLTPATGTWEQRT